MASKKGEIKMPTGNVENQLDSHTEQSQDKTHNRPYREPPWLTMLRNMMHSADHYAREYLEGSIHWYVKQLTKSAEGKKPFTCIFAKFVGNEENDSEYREMQIVAAGQVHGESIIRVSASNGNIYDFKILSSDPKIVAVFLSSPICELTESNS